MKMKDQVLNRLRNDDEFVSDYYHCFHRVIILLEQYEELGTIEELKDMLSDPDIEYAKATYDATTTSIDTVVLLPNLNEEITYLLYMLQYCSTLSREEIEYIKNKVKKLNEYMELGTADELSYIKKVLKGESSVRIEKRLKAKITKNLCRDVREDYTIMTFEMLCGIEKYNAAPFSLYLLVQPAHDILNNMVLADMYSVDNFTDEEINYVIEKINILIERVNILFTDKKLELITREVKDEKGVIKKVVESIAPNYNVSFISTNKHFVYIYNSNNDDVWNSIYSHRIQYFLKRFYDLEYNVEYDKSGRERKVIL